MTQTLQCLGPNGYQVVVGTNIFHQIAQDLVPGGSLGLSSGTSIVIITDNNVWKYYGHVFLQTLTTIGKRSKTTNNLPLVKVLPPGEQTKNRSCKEEIEDWMLEQRCLRDTVIIAFGGGVIGDLAGYVASTYMRGVPVVQVPTTLLAMVDSSIGGKTAVDTPSGKNLIGAFHQPKRVYIDPTFLITLPSREISNGMAEIIKAGIIQNSTLFDLCELHADEIIGTNDIDIPVQIDTVTGTIIDIQYPESLVPRTAASSSPSSSSSPSTTVQSSTLKGRNINIALLSKIITLAADVKVQVVTSDEKESNLRAILNYGHTIGHGIEALLQPHYLHGECVSIGMVKEIEISRALGYCDSGLVSRVKRCCKAFKLPITLPEYLSYGNGLDEVLQHMAIDKKNTKTNAQDDPKIQCVLIRRIGEIVAPPYSHGIRKSLIHRVMSSAVTITVPTTLSASSALSFSAPVTIRVPGSKSISNRALLLAGLAKGTTIIYGLLASDDTQVMLNCLSDIGAKVRFLPSTGTRDSSSDAVEITGTGGNFSLPPINDTVTGQYKHLYVQNAGTASRFLASILCLLPFDSDRLFDPNSSSLSSSSRFITLEGNARMGERPIGPLVTALREQGAVITYSGKENCPPLRYTYGISPYQDSRGKIPLPSSPSIAQTYIPSRRIITLEAKVSSQYVSSVLMASPYFLPLMVPPGYSFPSSDSAFFHDDTSSTVDPTENDPHYVELRLAEKNPTSLPYITMTLATMEEFGIKVIRLADNRYLIPRTTYVTPGNYEIEADASSASYPAAIAAVTGRTVILEGIGSNSLQGDAKFPLLLARMGCTVNQELRRTIITGPPRSTSSSSSSPSQGLHGIDVNMAEQTDCFMTLAVVAAVASGTTRITGIANQRVKECNRIAAMITELGKCGIRTKELDDGLEIIGTGELGSVLLTDSSRTLSSVVTPSKAYGAIVHCYDDHRIAMSFGVLNTVVPDIIMDDAACVEKTYPEFWDHVEQYFRYTVHGANAHISAVPLSSVPSSSPLIPVTSRIILIGMRGAGKTTLGTECARQLHCPLLDLDAHLVTRYNSTHGIDKSTITDIIQKEGWNGFRTLEVSILRDVLSSEPSEYLQPILTSATNNTAYCVFACGGGIVETEEGRTLLQTHVRTGGIVIEIRRDIDDIAIDLGQLPSWEQKKFNLTNDNGSIVSPSVPTDTQRPSYAGGANLHDVYQRRQLWYEQCSSHVFPILAGEREWNFVNERFIRLVKQVVERMNSSSFLSSTPASESLASLNWPTILTPSPSSSLPMGTTDGNAFVCIALPDIRCLAMTDKEIMDTVSSSTVSYPHTYTLPSSDTLNTLADKYYTITQNCAAVELRIDCLRNYEPSFILYQLSLLRFLLQYGQYRALYRTVDNSNTNQSVINPTLRRICPPVSLLPIIFTIRSTIEGGKFLPSEEKLYASLNQLAVRTGCEYIDLEYGRNHWSLSTLNELTTLAHGTGGCRTIASGHWPLPSNFPNQTEITNAIKYCYNHGKNDIIKLVAMANNPQDVFTLQNYIAIGKERLASTLTNTASGNGSSPSSSPVLPPFITLAMGESGKLSRVINDYFTPVAHPLLPTMAAPGQLSLNQIRTLRTEIGTVRSRSYYLFGTPIQQSISPRIHNTGFQVSSLPHRYGLAETSDPQAVINMVKGLTVSSSSVTLHPPSYDLSSPEKWTMDTFPRYVGGGNVTIPLKQDVAKLCDRLSPAAAYMGAVNVLVTYPSSVVSSSVPLVYGDNTDWLGIYWPLYRYLTKITGPSSPTTNNNDNNGVVKKSAILCIGAGGTSHAVAYAVQQLKFVFPSAQLLVYNRTLSKATEVAQKYHGYTVDNLDNPHTLQTVLESIGNDYTISAIISVLPTSVGWTVPSWLITAYRPLIFDVAYRPRETPLLKQAKEYNLPYVEGVEMLIIQGLTAFALWTGQISSSSSSVSFSSALMIPPSVPVVAMTTAAYTEIE